MAKKNKVVNPYRNKSTVVMFNRVADFAIKSHVGLCDKNPWDILDRTKLAVDMITSGATNVNDYVNEYMDNMKSAFAEYVRTTQVFNATYLTEKLLSDFYEVNRARARGDKFFKNTNLEAKERISKFLNVQKNVLTGEYYSESLYKYTLPNPNVYVELANTKDLYVGVLITTCNNICVGYILTYQPEGVEHMTHFTLNVDESSDDELPSWEVTNIVDPYLGEYHIGQHGTDLEDGTDEATLMSLVVRPITLVMEIFHRVNNTSKKQYNFYSEDTNEKPHYVNYKGGKCVLSNRPTYIILDKDIKEVRKYARKSDSKLEYSFSWIVRGHYRRLQHHEHMGTDMFGKPVQGKTWIASYVKGDKNLPLKNTNYKIKMA